MQPVPWGMQAGGRDQLCPSPSTVDTIGVSDQMFSSLGTGRDGHRQLLLPLASEKCFKLHELTEISEAATGQKRQYFYLHLRNNF